MPAVVSIKNARKSFGAVEVLRDISLEVARGEVVAVIGPSGGGKSTLLRCMTLLETLDAGGLSYGEVDVAVPGGGGTSVYAKGDVLKRARGRFGLVFQNYNLFPHFTVMRNIVDAPIRVQHRDRIEVERRARELIERMGLEGCEDKVPCQLSGGQQQRVGLVRALAAEPRIMLLDEPFGAIDALTRASLQDELLHIHRGSGKTFIFVTHDVAEAMKLATKILVVDAGRVQQFASPDELAAPPRPLCASCWPRRASWLRRGATPPPRHRRRGDSDGRLLLYGKPRGPFYARLRPTPAAIGRHHDRLLRPGLRPHPGLP